jgi:hypothetical protein
VGGEVLVPLLVSPVLGDAVVGKQTQRAEKRISLPNAAGFDVRAWIRTSGGSPFG